MTDFFIASNEDLKCLESRPLVEGQLAGLVDSEVDLLMLCNLESILTGQEWESIFDTVYVNPAREQGPDGPWIYQVSGCLLQALVNLTADELIDCANKWSETDEWTLRDDMSPEKIAEVLSQLVTLAERALSNGKTLYIWTRP